jgi:hypothetical protein
MPLPVGTWTIDANGSTGTLIIGSGAAGTFNGTALGQPLSGFFNETDQEFSFIRVTSPDVSTFEIYNGTLFSFSPNVSTAIFTLGGTFRTYPPAGGAVSPFAWSAQLSQKLKEKEGKDSKDKEQSKDTKDIKDRKDNKELGKDVEKHPKDKELEALPQFAAADATATMDQLSQRLSAVEQAMAVGQAFISTAERPVVGAQAPKEKKPT